MMHAAKTSTTLAAAAAAVLFLNASLAQAFHVESGTSCTEVGASCSYYSDDSSAGGSSESLVNGFCASDNICASNGAKCSSDDDCYNYCGTDGICGGTGAGCNTQSVFEPGQSGIACGSDYTCSADGSVGTCEASSSKAAAVGDDDEDPAAAGASQAATRRNKRRMDAESYHHRQVRSSDLRHAAVAGRLSPRKHL